jgi:hypothetical protein
MRRISVLLLVIAMALVIASPAGAGKPGTDCEEKPNHPACQDDPTADPPFGTTCLVRFGPDNLDMQVKEVDLNVGSFSVNLEGSGASACYDVTADEGTWSVEILNDTGVRFLRVLPRDSISPGDSCGGREFRFNRDVPTTFDLPGTGFPTEDGWHPYDLDKDGRIEGSYANSCGESFGEWVDVEVNGVEKRVFYEKENTNIPSPLAFQVDMKGSKTAVLELEVTLVPLP